MIEKTYQKDAWVLTTTVGLAGIVFGSIYFAGIMFDESSFQYSLGQSWSSFTSTDPKAAAYAVGLVQYIGATLIVLSFFVVAISYTAFRGGQRWSWYAFLVGLVYLVYSATVQAYSKSMVWPVTSTLALFTLAALALSYRRFFPGKR